MSEPVWPLDSTFYSFMSYSGISSNAQCSDGNSLDMYLREATRTRNLPTGGGYGFLAFAGDHGETTIAPVSDPEAGPRPFVHFVAKVVSRCNIQCSYCYMYEHADQTWRTMPTHMSEATEAAMIDRIESYLVTRRPPAALVILHGGEPLLYGAQRINRLAERLRRARERHGVVVDLAIQTNATIVDDAIIGVLTRHGIRVGVSLDGPPQTHDANRRDTRGHGTYERVSGGLRRLLAATSEGLPPPAVTAVIDPTTQPRDVIAHFLELGIERVDFQLPDLNHDTYPHKRWPAGTFGAWLIELYEELWRLEQPLRVRSIELLIRLLLGAPYGGDILGEHSFGTLVIDTDGSYHAHDALKATFNGATATGRSVRTDDISSVETHPMVLAFTNKASAAAITCRRCPLFAVCGGGLVAHRYSASRGYDSTSVYCTDLAMLIRHVDSSIERWREEQDSA
jgi:uncharacterized protein